MMGDGSLFVGHKGDRETHEGKLFPIAAKINGVNVSQMAVLSIIKIRDN